MRRLGRDRRLNSAHVAGVARRVAPGICVGTLLDGKFGGLGASAIGSFGATSSRQRVSLMGRLEALTFAARTPVGRHSNQVVGLPPVGCLCSRPKAAVRERLLSPFETLGQLLSWSIRSAPLSACVRTTSSRPSASRKAMEYAYRRAAVHRGTGVLGLAGQAPDRAAVARTC